MLLLYALRAIEGEDNKTDQNWLWYIDLGIIAILQNTKHQTDRSKLNLSCALCLHHCTLCSGNRLPSCGCAFHLNFYSLSVYYFIILKFSPVSLFRALLDCKVEGSEKGCIMFGEDHISPMRTRILNKRWEEYWILYPKLHFENICHVTSEMFMGSKLNVCFFLKQPSSSHNWVIQWLIWWKT